MEDAARILVYHSVLPDGERVERATQVSARVFQSQLEWIRRAGYEVVPVGRLPESPRQAGRRRLAITFDDGYRDNFEIAWPLLSAFGFPATFFISTDFVGGYARFNQEWQPRMMEWEHLREMADGGMEIGSHTVTHPDLGALERSDLIREVCISRSVLQSRLGCRVHSISYPYGAHSRSVLDAVERAGYRLGCAVDRCAGDARPWLALRRTMIREADTGPRLALKLSGLYRWLRDGAAGGAARRCV